MTKPNFLEIAQQTAQRCPFIVLEGNGEDETARELTPEDIQDMANGQIWAARHDPDGNGEPVYKFGRLSWGDYVFCHYDGDMDTAPCFIGDAFDVWMEATLDRDACFYFMRLENDNATEE